MARDLVLIEVALRAAGIELAPTKLDCCNIAFLIRRLRTLCFGQQPPAIGRSRTWDNWIAVSQTLELFRTTAPLG